jgi:hypothetical protein
MGRMETYVVPPFVIEDWKSSGGFLVRSEVGAQWRIEHDSGDVQPDFQVAWFQELTGQVESGDVSFPEGVEIVKVRQIRPSDIKAAPVSHSMESSYMDLDGYVFRISTHPPLTGKSIRGLVLDVRLPSSAIEERWFDPDAGYEKVLVDREAAEAELRQAAMKWLKDQRRQSK